MTRVGWGLAVVRSGRFSQVGTNGASPRRRVTTRRRSGGWFSLMRTPGSARCEGCGGGLSEDADGATSSGQVLPACRDREGPRRVAGKRRGGKAARFTATRGYHIHRFLRPTWRSPTSRQRFQGAAGPMGRRRLPTGRFVSSWSMKKRPVVVGSACPRGACTMKGLFEARGEAGMIDHAVVRVSDLGRPALLRGGLTPLGYRVVKQFETFVGLGSAPSRSLDRDAVSTRPPAPIWPSLAGRGPSGSFLRTRPEAGGRDNGPPASGRTTIRNYYGAFVLDRTETTSRSLVWGVGGAVWCALWRGGL